MDGVDPRPLLDQLHREGVEACRWFASLLTPSSTRTGCSLENAERRSLDVATWLQERSLWGHAVGYCDTAAWFDWARLDAHAAWFGRFLAEHPWLIGEAVNEIGHGTQVAFTDGDLERLVSRIRQAGYRGPLTAGAWVVADELVSGHYPPAEVAGCDGVDTHFERTDDPAWDQINHGFAELRVIQLEYGGWRISGEPNQAAKVAPRHVYAYLLGAEAQGFNTWTTLHSSALRECQVLTGADLDDVRWFVRGGHILPRGRYHYENANNTGGWSNSPIKSAAFCEGPSSRPGELNVWRAHSFKHLPSGQWFAVIYGPNVVDPDTGASRAFVEFQHGFGFDQQIDRVGQYIDIRTLRQG